MTLKGNLLSQINLDGVQESTLHSGPNEFAQKHCKKHSDKEGNKGFKRQNQISVVATVVQRVRGIPPAVPTGKPR